MNTYKRTVLDAPASLVSNGKCNFGTFNAAVKNINPLEAAHPLNIPAPRALKFMRLKEWQAFQLSNPEWFICLAVYNSKAVGLAIVMAYNKNEDRMYRYEHKVPFFNLHVPSGLTDSRCWYHSRNFTIDIRNNLKEGRFDVDFQARNFAGLPDCNAYVTGFHETEPIVICQPFGDNRPLYSHKALMPAEGYLENGGQRSFFRKKNSCMILDDHKGYYPYVMKYDWVTACGFDAQGRLMGFNCTDNQVQDHDRYNENCLWLDGKMYPLPPIKIKRPTGVENTWEISDDYGQVRLYFIPKQDVPVYINLGIAETRYHGPAGMLEGYIMSPEGEKICFDGFFGMGEKKYIKM